MIKVADLKKAVAYLESKEVGEVRVVHTPPGHFHGEEVSLTNFGGAVTVTITTTQVNVTTTQQEKL